MYLGNSILLNFYWGRPFWWEAILLWDTSSKPYKTDYRK